MGTIWAQLNGSTWRNKIMPVIIEVDYVDKLNNAKYKLCLISLAMSGRDDITKECKNGIDLILWEIIGTLEEIADKANQHASHS